MSAATAVLDTTELLEEILTHLSELSIGNVWRAQHINKRARSVIKGSHALSARLYAVVRPGDRVLPAGTPFPLRVFNNIAFDCCLESRRQGHRWRRKLDLPCRNIEKPEDRIPRLITKCFNAASNIRKKHKDSAFVVLLDSKDKIHELESQQHSIPTSKNPPPTEYEKVYVLYTQLLGSNDPIHAVKCTAWTAVVVRKGCTTRELMQVVTHMVFAHPFRDEVPPWTEPGNTSDPMVLRWKWKGYSQRTREARRTISARAFMLDEPTYGVRISGRAGWFLMKLRWHLARFAARNGGHM